MKIKRPFASISSFIKSFHKWRDSLREYSYLKSLFTNVERRHSIKNTIVFNTVKCVRDHIDREFFLGKLLALYGAKVFMLLDNGLLKHWELGKKKNHSYYFRNYKNLIYLIFFRNLMRKALKTYTDKNLQIIYYSDILKNVDQKNWKNLKKFARSSTVRYFQTSELDYNDARVKDYYNLSLKNSLLSRNIGEYVLKKIQPNYFVTSHGIYSTWGPAFEFVKKKGVNSLILARNHNHSMDPQDTYFTDTLGQILSQSKFWKLFKDTQVTEEMRKKSKEWINQRITHKLKDTVVYYEKNLSHFKVDKNDGYKFHIAIFPSLIWDGDIQERHIAFDGILDWLISTIDFFKNNKEVRIFLKFHPAEVTSFKGSAKIQDLIHNYLDINEINNLVLIPTEKKIDPYEFLLSGIDLGICYDGVLAIEMPFLRIPALLGGVGGRFSVDGGNFTIKTREDYFNYLKHFKEVIQDFHDNYEKYINNVTRYTYWYIFENVVKLATMPKIYRGKLNLLLLTKKDLVLSKKILDIFTS